MIHGDVTSLPALAVDLATITGNVSNVFLTQQEWLTTLSGSMWRSAPAATWCSSPWTGPGPWLNWNRETTYIRATLLTRVCSRAGSR